MPPFLSATRSLTRPSNLPSMAFARTMRVGVRVAIPVGSLQRSGVPPGSVQVRSTTRTRSCAGAMSRQEDGGFALLVEFHHVVTLLLREQQTAVFAAHDAIGILAALPDHSPLLARIDHSGNRRDRYFFWRRGSRERPLRRKRAKGEKSETGHEKKTIHRVHDDVIPPCPVFVPWPTRKSGRLGRRCILD